MLVSGAGNASVVLVAGEGRGSLVPPHLRDGGRGSTLVLGLPPALRLQMPHLAAIVAGSSLLLAVLLRLLLGTHRRHGLLLRVLLLALAAVLPFAFALLEGYGVHFHSCGLLRCCPARPSSLSTCDELQLLPDLQVRLESRRIQLQVLGDACVLHSSDDDADAHVVGEKVSALVLVPLDVALQAVEAGNDGILDPGPQDGAEHRGPSGALLWLPLSMKESPDLEPVVVRNVLQLVLRLARRHAYQQVVELLCEPRLSRGRVCGERHGRVRRCGPRHQVPEIGVQRAAV